MFTFHANLVSNVIFLAEDDFQTFDDWRNHCGAKVTAN